MLSSHMSLRQDNNQNAETNASNESMSPWSWNNRGRSSERCWARFHACPAEHPPPPTTTPQTTVRPLHMSKIWITFETHFAFEIGLSEADRPYQEHRGATAPPIHRTLIRGPRPHPSIYALHKFYWHAVIEIKLIVNWRAFLSQRRTRGLGQYLRDEATDRDSWIPNRPWMGASLIIPDCGNTLIYSIWRYRSPQIIKRSHFKRTLPSHFKCYRFQLLPKQQKQQPRHRI